MPFISQGLKGRGIFGRSNFHGSLSSYIDRCKNFHFQSLKKRDYKKNAFLVSKRRELKRNRDNRKFNAGYTRIQSRRLFSLLAISFLFNKQALLKSNSLPLPIISRKRKGEKYNTITVFSSLERETKKK